MLSFLRKKKKNLFIHIPKAGGSTFVGVLKDSLKTNGKNRLVPTHKTEKVGNVEISHVNFSTPERTFKKAEIFNIESQNQFKKGYNLFMLVRHPVDRVISEFNFQYHILGGKNGNPTAAILAQLPKQPQNIKQYIAFPNVQNYQVKFLLGRRLGDPNPVTEAEFERLTATILNLPIHCGVTDQYPAFLALFETISKEKLKNQVVVRKKTPNAIKQNISEATRNKIAKVNDYDFRLYNFVKELDYIKNSNVERDYDFKTDNKFIV